MRITVYHGSENIIYTPQYGVGNIHNDYGLGFYCTEHVELAKEWACTGGHGGYANRYTLDMDDLSALRLNEGGYHILNWLAVLLENRTFSINSDIRRNARDYILSEFLPDYVHADIIVGYRADDSYFSFANAFLNNGLSLRQLGKAMCLGNLGEQIVIKSRRAFEHIEFDGYEIAEKAEYFPKRQLRDEAAREEYRKELSVDDNDVYMIDIIRQRWRNDDVRLQGRLS